MPKLSDTAPNMFSNNLINAQKSQLVCTKLTQKGALLPGGKSDVIFMGKNAKLEFLGSIKVKDGLRLDGPIRAAFKVKRMTSS